jgi:NitT/TauT family transport system ATP-binding protein
MAAAKLEVRNVSKSFRRPDGQLMPVVVALSLMVTPLEFVALLGPSGCGKSTLLRMIDGLLPCDTGSIYLDGEDITGVPGKGRGMVFQTFDLFPWRTALGNVEFGLEVQGVPNPKRRERARRYLGLVGLQGFEDSFPHQLSGGMQQRVGIARAFAIQPEVLLMDEPFGALDVQTRDILQDELLHIWEQDQIYLADRIVVFSPRPARIVQEIRVPFSRPRREDMKTDPSFLALRREIWQMLKQGVRA